MKKPTLLILAAGMGSRYGGVKQLAAVGPNDEAIIDYSIFDAIRAGFGKIIFLVREDIAIEVENNFKQKLLSKIEFEIVIQKGNEPKSVFENILKDAQPLSPSPSRTKPFGTAHAVLCAKDFIQSGFCVINADDFYGYDALNDMATFLYSSTDETKQAMIGYSLADTLSDYGGVSRGICSLDQKHNLISIAEIKNIAKSNSGIFGNDGNNTVSIPADALVSMNIWGFKQSIFPLLEKYFEEFLIQNKNNVDAEFYIPMFVEQAIKKDGMCVKVIPGKSKWFGITFQNDRSTAAYAIKNLIAQNKYPQNLWG